MLRECVVCSTAVLSVSTALSSAYFFFFFFSFSRLKNASIPLPLSVSSWAWKSCGINFRDWELCLIFHNLETGFMSNCRKQFSQIYTRAQEWLTVLAHAASLGMRDVWCVCVLFLHLHWFQSSHQQQKAELSVTCLDTDSQGPESLFFQLISSVDQEALKWEQEGST